MKNSTRFLSSLLFLLLAGCLDNPEIVVITPANPEFVTGLHGPIGMVMDEKKCLEVSWQVGFQDPSYFSKCFQKQYGKKPSESISQSG